MSKTKPSAPSPSSFPPTQSVIVGGIALAALALLFYLLFSAPDIAADGTAVRPSWYRIGTYVFQTIAIAISGFLCLRNWRSTKIISGRNVWLGLGIGIVSWGVGNSIFGVMDLALKSPPTPPAIPDVFFTLTYVFLSWGMAMSVIGRRLNLFPKQWAIVFGVGVFGLIIGTFVTFIAGGEGNAFDLSPQKIINAIYALGDVWLLIVATILLLAFWGGKAAQSWRLIGTAGISMFIGDLGFAYSSKSPTYQSGDWIEFFWILAFVLFGMGAALEYDLSTKPSSRRR